MIGAFVRLKLFLRCAPHPRPSPSTPPPPPPAQTVDLHQEAHAALVDMQQAMGVARRLVDVDSPMSDASDSDASDIEGSEVPEGDPLFDRTYCREGGGGAVGEKTRGMVDTHHLLSHCAMAAG